MSKIVAMARRLQDGAFVKYLKVKDFLQKKQEGATLVEYALLVALIAMVCIAAIAVLGTYINNVFCNIKSHLSSNGVS
jgi:pilus assembly protein Flp/PilA